MDIKVGITTLAVVGTLVLGACEEKSTNKLVLGQKSVACDINMDNLAGTEWVIEKILPGR